jgi:hypothetical protein
MKFITKIVPLHAFFSPVRTTTSVDAKKICKDCRHFIGNKLECGKFSDSDIITGRVTYPYARSARENKEKCGEDAIHFEENPYKIITAPYYFCKENWLLLVPGTLFTVYFHVILDKLQNLQ